MDEWWQGYSLRLDWQVFYNVLIEAPYIEWPGWEGYWVTGGTRLNLKLINRLPSETEPHKDNGNQTWLQETD